MAGGRSGRRRSRCGTRVLGSSRRGRNGGAGQLWRGELSIAESAEHALLDRWHAAERHAGECLRDQPPSRVQQHQRLPGDDGRRGYPGHLQRAGGGRERLFSATASSTVTVGSDASGAASAPPLTANYAAGAYTVIASSAYGSVSFALTNAEAGGPSGCGADANATASTGVAPAKPAGRPATLTVGVGATQSAPAAARFPIRLAVTVTDADKDPV